MDEETLRIKLGVAIRTRRSELGFSQDSFADQIEMHRAYYSSIERGERNLTLSTMARVASGLKCALAELFKSARL